MSNLESSSVNASITFKCCECKSTAEMFEVDDAINRVSCPACDIFVDGEDARLMFETLRLRYVEQEGSNIVRRELGKRRMGRVPLRKVFNEFSDPRWPFILKVDVNT